MLCERNLRCGEGAVQMMQTAGKFGVRALIWKERVILTSGRMRPKPQSLVVCIVV